MAATGKEYVTLEQLKDLLDNEIKPLIQQASEAAQAAQEDANKANAFNANMVGTANMALPTKIDSNGTSLVATIDPFLTISENGKVSSAIGYVSSPLFKIIGSIMLAAPNGDTTKLLGYLGDNTANLADVNPVPRSSAALTYAAEQPDYEGSVYGVPVSVDSDGKFTLAIQGVSNPSCTIHEGETLFVCSSDSDSFKAGQVLCYAGAEDVELSDTGRGLAFTGPIYTPPETPSVSVTANQGMFTAGNLANCDKATINIDGTSIQVPTVNQE